MPRHEITERDLYRYDELTEQAQDRARDAYRAMLDACWDSSDTDMLAEAITYEIGASFGDPANETHGAADYELPGNVKLTEWDLDRASCVKLRGTIGPDDAPKFPWPTGDDVTSTWIEFGNRDYGRHVVAHVECECERVYLGDGNYQTCAHIDALDALQSAAEQALADGLAAGRAELEYMRSDEYIAESIDANGREFTENGDLA